MNKLKHLWPYMLRYRWMLLTGLLCALVGAGVEALGPYLLRLAVDDIQAGAVVPAVLLRYGGLLLLVALVSGLFNFGRRLLIAGASYRIEYDLRHDLFARFMQLDQRFYSQNYTGDLMARATNDLSAVRQFLGPGISGAASSLFTLLAVAALMFGVNVALSLVVLLLLPVASLVFFLIGRRMRTIFTHVQDQFGSISTRAQENFSGIRTIKAYAQEEAEIGVFADENRRYRDLNLGYVLLSGALWPSMALMLGLIGALVLLVGGQQVAAGNLTVGELVQFNGYLALLAWPAIMASWMVNLYQQGAASMGRLLEVLRREPAVATAPDSHAVGRLHGEIEFRDVGIRFHVDEQQKTMNDERGTLIPATSEVTQSAVRSSQFEWVLRHISFRVPAGTSLAIVGATGAGKTTLVNLLGRVRDPDEGQVLVDGVDVRELDLAGLRRNLAYVPQETFLFSVPLRENVAFGLHGEEPADVATQLDRAVATSRLSNDLSQFPDGLDTLVGERGVTLSGGQKQRVAIARAVLRDPALLVLDDALSSVDTHTAAEILASLREVMRNRTTIIIAQRVGTVKDANQIIVLHEGEIVERGTHQELVRHGGRYAAMYRRELLESELEG
ncbi:MAG: ABC transporter ATP-binding protein/permease [Chloroflexaceae bacterium]|nr:ABC transporter ATP-binding protein/permease [Chloroflexaceae bacterium]